MNWLHKIKFEWLCFIFLFFTGTVLSFLTPVYQLPDEVAHFARAWQISEFTFISPVKNSENGKKDWMSYVPSVFLEKYMHNLFQAQGRYSFNDVKEFLSAPLNDVLIELKISNTGTYAPIIYFPQALFGYLVRIFGGTAGQIYYAMRIGAVFFAALCMFWSIRLLPEKGLLIFLLGMMPMFLAESASTSADCVLYGTCIFVSAYILSLTKTREKLTAKQIFVLIFMSILIGLLKQIYGTIILLYFLIPYERLGTRRNYILFGLFLLVVCLVSSFAWLYVSVAKSGVSTAIGEKANIEEQIKFFMSDPVRGCMILIRSNIAQLLFYAGNFIGILGWLTVYMPMWFYFLYAVFLIAGALFGKLNINLWHRLIMMTGCLSTLLAIDFYEYFTWTASGALWLEGVQGRYFIPISLMGLSLFSFFPRLKYENIIALFAGLLSMIVAIIATFLYFYAGITV